MNKTLSLLAVLILTAGPAAAVPALQDLGREAGVDTAVMAQSLEAARAMAAASAASRRALTIPRGGKDVFEGCSAMDAKTFVALNPKQAALLVQTCLNHAYAAGGRYSVRASAERFGSRACPENAGGASCRAIVEVEGIKITVSGEILTGDPVLLDLDASLQARGGKLLGFPAVVDNRARIQN